MRLDPNNPRQPRPDETGPMKKKEGERNRPGANPEHEDEGGYVEEERKDVQGSARRLERRVELILLCR